MERILHRHAPVLSHNFATWTYRYSYIFCESWIWQAKGTKWVDFL